MQGYHACQSTSGVVGLSYLSLIILGPMRSDRSALLRAAQRYMVIRNYRKSPNNLSDETVCICSLLYDAVECTVI